jgi:hypothetical protein
VKAPRRAAPCHALPISMPKKREGKKKAAENGQFEMGVYLAMVEDYRAKAAQRAEGGDAAVEQGAPVQVNSVQTKPSEQGSEAHVGQTTPAANETERAERAHANRLRFIEREFLERHIESLAPSCGPQLTEARNPSVFAPPSSPQLVASRQPSAVDHIGDSWKSQGQCEAALAERATLKLPAPEHPHIALQTQPKLPVDGANRGQPENAPLRVLPRASQPPPSWLTRTVDAPEESGAAYSVVSIQQVRLVIRYAVAVSHSPFDLACAHSDAVRELLTERGRGRRAACGCWSHIGQ